MAAPKTDNPVLVAFVLDFETGGLKSQIHACTQIAMHAIRLDTFEKLGSYVSYIYPYNHKDINGVGKKKKVLKDKHAEAEEEPMQYEETMMKEKTGITMDMLYEQGKPIEQVGQEVLQFIKDNTPENCPKIALPFLVGQNIPFDESFFCQLMEYSGLVKEYKKCMRGQEDFYGHWHPMVMDTILLEQLSLCTQPNVHSYKLEIICEFLGIDLDDAHDADADVTATVNVLRAFTERLRNANGESGGETLAVAQVEKTRKHFKI